MRILLIEDDPMIGESVRAGLQAGGFVVDWIRDGQGALLALETTSYSLVVLDLGLPKLDGMSVLKQLRKSSIDTPVLIVTAREAIADRIAGLDNGADDYLTKPFDLNELTARARALIRRHAGRANAEIVVGPLVFNSTTCEVTLRGKPLHLSARELALLQVLMEKPGAVRSREELEDGVYGWGEEVSSNAIEVHLYNLRKKVGQDIIRNVRGVGYKVVDPDGLPA